MAQPATRFRNDRHDTSIHSSHPSSIELLLNYFSWLMNKEDSTRRSSRLQWKVEVKKLSCAVPVVMVFPKFWAASILASYQHFTFITSWLSTGYCEGCRVSAYLLQVSAAECFFSESFPLLFFRTVIILLDSFSSYRHRHLRPLKAHIRLEVRKAWHRTQKKSEWNR